MKSKQLVFIDDSGDPGVKTHSSSHFVMAAIVFNDDLVAEEAALAMRKFRRQLGWTDDHEYKFSKTKKDYIKQVLRLVAQYDFNIYAIVVNKAKFSTMPKNASIKIDGYKGTNYTKRAISQVRKNANAPAGQIIEIKFVDSTENVLVQLADLVASSIFRSTQTKKADHADYVAILEKHLAQVRQS
jgi:hypothetical protein